MMLARRDRAAEPEETKNRRDGSRNRIHRTIALLQILSTWMVWAGAATAATETTEAQETTIRLRSPTRPLLTGSVTFVAEVSGPASEVRFALDGETRVQRRTPPFEATLFLGHLPSEHHLEATALDASGRVVATDAILLNPRPAVLRVEFLAPRSGVTTSSNPVTMILDLISPPGAVIDRLDLYRDDVLLETIERPDRRVVRNVSAPASTRFLRALVTTDDGRSAEAVTLLNSPPAVAELEVRYVQLYVRARTRRGGRPVLDLSADELEVLEDDRPQVIRRFEPVQDLPLNLLVLFDVSASIRTRLADSVAAARTFFDDALRPDDRATLIAFNDRARLLVEHSASVEALSKALESVQAGRGTSLHDALVYGLYQLEGLSGQRAAVLFSDGRDESSRTRFEDMIEYAQRAGIPVYAVRLETERPARRSRDDLRALAEATGGLAFFVEETNELPQVYDQILSELRTRYLVTFQSDQTDRSDRFRRIELKTTRRGITVESRPGYLP